MFCSEPTVSQSREARHSRAQYRPKSPQTAPFAFPDDSRVPPYPAPAIGSCSRSPLAPHDGRTESFGGGFNSISTAALRMNITQPVGFIQRTSHLPDPPLTWPTPPVQLQGAPPAQFTPSMLQSLPGAQGAAVRSQGPSTLSSNYGTTQASLMGTAPFGDMNLSDAMGYPQRTFLVPASADASGAFAFGSFITQPADFVGGFVPRAGTLGNAQQPADHALSIFDALLTQQVHTGQWPSHHNGSSVPTSLYGLPATQLFQAFLSCWNLSPASQEQGKRHCVWK
ncbi:hypothetical protein M427DRAFT_468076 [Gonapodya prolifera JEL478]|uniref:Uncharacterized protein n=1 Tax=Gonapodya prolifera (strain JEL478) TaxID=1344416 RepID=A0A139A1N9_GONPJ|nr:hypothetical protein M427DRAFT_468076 [Gonapodya prolifera JEL478]|eukprot:KXS10654.1 hypothetical protein M427DRAFT_468076 [Gonapodya prolifera JEL478]